MGKMAQVKERGGALIFWFLFHAVKTENSFPWSFCSETKRKRLLRRLGCSPGGGGEGTAIYGLYRYVPL